jgi:hypothetical protein
MTFNSFASLLLGCVALVLFATCHSSDRVAAVDRRDPDAVLRAYFVAWDHNDTDTQKSFMAARYREADWYSEPVGSVTLVSAKVLDEQSARLWSTGAPDANRVYQVVFDYNPEGRGFSMARGRYTWTYTLTWDGERSSWLISNYGAG